MKRLRYYLSDEEAEIIEDLRSEKRWRKEEAKTAALPRCTECEKRPGYSSPAKQDNLCGNHWNMRHAKSVATLSPMNILATC